MAFPLQPIVTPGGAQRASVFVIEDEDLFEEKITGTDRPFSNWHKGFPKTFYADGVRFHDGSIAALAQH